QLDDNVLPEARESRFAAGPRAKSPDVVRPVLECGIVRHPPFKRDGVEARAAGGLPGAAGICPLPVLDDLRRSPESTDPAHPGDDLAVPLHPKLEVLVRIEPLGVHRELRHGSSLMSSSCRISSEDSQRNTLRSRPPRPRAPVPVTQSTRLGRAPPRTACTPPLHGPVLGPLGGDGRILSELLASLGDN